MKMDQEKMSSPKDPKNTQCGRMALLVTAVLVLCTLLSSIAMVMSALAFYNQTTSQNVIHIEDDPVWEEETLSELERLLERDGLMKFSDHRYNKTQPSVVSEGVRVQRNDRDPQVLDDKCNSTKFSNYSDYLPAAHIMAYVQEGRYVRPIGEESHLDTYVVVTKNWRCSSITKRRNPDAPFTIMSGGMVFNRSSGTLTLPKDGVYYVYSHIQFRLEKSGNIYETAARMAACIPGEGCKMNKYVYPGLTESKGTISQNDYKVNDKRPDPGDGNTSLYQGGIFHFPAGTQISILAKDPKYGLPDLQRSEPDHLLVSKDQEESYMGAYLVQEMAYIK